jgi:hypothetical protein
MPGAERAAWRLVRVHTGLGAGRGENGAQITCLV